jgi:hypothetical protein
LDKARGDLVDTFVPDLDHVLAVCLRSEL